MDEGTGADYDDDFVRIAEHEGAQFMEFPKEENETILLSTLQAQFPHAIGLKYKGGSGAWRAIREAENVLDAPKGGWGDRTYYLSMAETHKRPLDNGAVSDDCKHRQIVQPNPLLQDLAVIGLPYKTTDEELRSYFENNYGELVFSEVKYERETGKSRGFGFVRFKEEKAANSAVNGYHYFEGRRVEVRMKKDRPMKMFIGRVPHGTTVEDLNQHFSQYGQLTDTYIPTPFRNYAFITFASSEDAKNCMVDTHMLNGNRLNVIERNERNPDKDKQNADQNSYPGNNGMFAGGFTGNPGFIDYPNGVPGGGGQPNGMDAAKNGGAMDSDLKSMLYQFLANQKL